MIRGLLSSPKPAFVALLAIVSCLFLQTAITEAGIGDVIDRHAGSQSTPTPPPGGQGSPGQTCAGSISVVPSSGKPEDTVSIEIWIPALWRDKVDYVSVNASGWKSDAFSLGGGSYVYHWKVPYTTNEPGWADLASGMVLSIRFQAYQGKSVICAGATSFLVHIPVPLKIVMSAPVGSWSTPQRVESEIPFTVKVEEDGTPPYSITWNLGGEPRTATTSAKTDTQVKTFSYPGTKTISVAVVDAAGKSGAARGCIFFYKDQLNVGISGPSEIAAGTEGSWAAAVSGGTGPYQYSWNTAEWSSKTTYSKTFSSPGWMVIGLSVKDSYNIPGQASKLVEVTGQEVDPRDIDDDKDDYTENQGDCDDTDPNIRPGATEVCNHKDDNCNQETDEGVTVTFCRDSDGDYYGNPNDTKAGCESDEFPGYRSLSWCGDCDDSNKNISPHEEEICGDGIDQDCDGKDEPCKCDPPNVLCPDGICHVPGSVCCGSIGACAPAAPTCCGMGCCVSGSYCALPGFCCKIGYLPCSDGKTCCLAGWLCHPEGNCCPPGTVPISGGQCQFTQSSNVTNSVPAESSEETPAEMLLRGSGH